jgi:hypothetical protein
MMAGASREFIAGEKSVRKFSDKSPVRTIRELKRSSLIKNTPWHVFLKDLLHELSDFELIKLVHHRPT